MNSTPLYLRRPAASASSLSDAQAWVDSYIQQDIARVNRERDDQFKSGRKFCRQEPRLWERKAFKSPSNTAAGRVRIKSEADISETKAVMKQEADVPDIKVELAIRPSHTFKQEALSPTLKAGMLTKPIKIKVEARDEY